MIDHSSKKIDDRPISITINEGNMQHEGGKIQGPSLEEYNNRKAYYTSNR
jgi:hypothetical protein